MLEKGCRCCLEPVGSSIDHLSSFHTILSDFSLKPQSKFQSLPSRPSGKKSTRKVKLGIYAIKRVAAERSSSDFLAYEHAKRPDDRARLQGLSSHKCMIKNPYNKLTNSLMVTDVFLAVLKRRREVSL